MVENTEDLESILFNHWPQLFTCKTSERSTISKVSSRNWLIISSLNGLSYILKNASIENNLEIELKYLKDLNEYFSNEYHVPIPILTFDGHEHIQGKYWLYEYIQGNVYHDNDTSHLFDEAKLISLAKIISKYHQFLIQNSHSLSNQKKTTTREHLINELKQSADSISQSSSSTSSRDGLDLVRQYYLGCYPILNRLLNESLSRQEKSNIIRNYLIHRNIRPSKIIWSSTRSNEVIGILDFENINYDTLWRDLAVCLSTFCTSSCPSIITDVDRMRIFIQEYMKQMSGGQAKVSSQTEQEVFQLIVDEIILCAIEDFTFIYWQYIHQQELFQGIKALEFYYKRALWHSEHALKK